MSAPAPPVQSGHHRDDHRQRHRQGEKMPSSGGRAGAGPSGSHKRARPSAPGAPAHPQPRPNGMDPAAPKIPYPPLDALCNPLNKPQHAFRCQIRFKNELPEIPCDPKLLLPPLAADQLAAFKLTTLEQDLKQDLPLLPTLGITITPLTYKLYEIPQEPQPLHPDDAALLEGAGFKLRTGGPTPGPGRGRPAPRMTADVSWLMRTTYISNDPSNTRKMGEGTRGGHLKTSEDQNLVQELQDRDAQIAAIEKSFEAAANPAPVHPTNPGLRPLSVLPLLPALEDLSHFFIDVHFKEDPCKELDPHSRRRGQNKLLHSVVTQRLRNEQTGQYSSYVALLTPARPPEAAEGNVPPLPSPGSTREFVYGQEYEFAVNNQLQEGHFCIQMGSDRATYTAFDSRLDLKRPAAEGRRELEEAVAVPEAVYVKRRRLLQKDVDAKRERLEGAGHGEELVEYALARLGPVAEDDEDDVDDAELAQENEPGHGDAGYEQEAGAAAAEGVEAEGSDALFGSDEDDGAPQDPAALQRVGNMVAGMSDDDDL